jgi:hypothetical protein
MILSKRHFFSGSHGQQTGSGQQQSQHESHGAAQLGAQMSQTTGAAQSGAQVSHGAAQLGAHVSHGAAQPGAQVLQPQESLCRLYPIVCPTIGAGW